LISLFPWGQCYKTIYHGNLPPLCGNTSFSVKKLYCLGNQRGMPVKSFITLAHGSKLKYHGILLWYFNPRKSRVKTTVVKYRGIFVTLAPGLSKTSLLLNLFFRVKI
jgi:hypothetical protein